MIRKLTPAELVKMFKDPADETAANKNPEALDFLRTYAKTMGDLHAFAAAAKADNEGFIARCIDLNYAFSHPYYSRHLAKLASVVRMAVDDPDRVDEMFLAVATIEGGYKLRAKVRELITGDQKSTCQPAE